MKRIRYFLKLTLILFLFLCGNHFAQAQIFQKIKDQVKQTADQRVQDKATKMTNTSADKADTITNKTAKKIKTVFKSKSKTNNDQGTTNTNNTPATSEVQNQTTNSGVVNNTSQVSASDTGTPSLTVYQNYDFIPGDKIVFADDFMSDQTGEFPSHWGLIKGQGTVNQSGDKRVFNILQGNYAVMKPLVKNKEYLEDAFTIEFDYFINTGDDCGYGANVFFVDPTGDDNKFINVGRYKTAASSYFENVDLGIKDQDGVTINQSDEDFYNHWHHIAIAYKKPQIKVYIDQNRTLVIPNIGFQPKALEFGGSAGDEKCPIGISNVRVANGGNQNMLSSIFSGGNVFITHGITFDVNKSTLKPESMGVLNQIFAYLNQNKDVKIEIAGHTDNTGNASSNLTLSQQRAEAVKTQLINMGIDGSRLSTKGLGDTKPIASNETPEGKAINRRVELVRL